MPDFCSICGLVLAPQGSDYPRWSKTIRAVCWFDGRQILSGEGYDDEDVDPFLLPVPERGLHRFHRFRRGIRDIYEDSCYPFHAACWAIVEEVSPLYSKSNQSLYMIFESCHYYKTARALSWVHGYYLEDMLKSQSGDEFQAQNLVVAHRTNLEILKDPSPDMRVAQSRHKHSTVLNPRVGAYSRLFSLPAEILHSIMLYLPYHDILQLRKTCRTCHEHDLPHSYWESRFRVDNEAGFARSIKRHESDSWQDHFFNIRSELRDGPNQMNLWNRKRIWKLAVDLVGLIQTVDEPGRVLHGDPDPCMLAQRRTVSCLTTKEEMKGCRELVQRFAHWGERTALLCAVTPSYVFVSNRRLVSGITFAFRDGTSVDIGYVVGRQKHPLSFVVLPKFLWLVSSPLGIEEVTLDAYPQSILEKSSGVAVSKWALDNYQSFSFGLDAIRIVRVSQGVQSQQSLDNVVWAASWPSIIPSMHNDDIATLYSLQDKLFAPVSTLCIKPEMGSIVAIVIHAPLGSYAGITGIRFVYEIGTENLWGSDYNAASISFFLGSEEHLVNIKVYKFDSVVCHLQFTTNRGRTSDFLPPLPPISRLSYECTSYGALNGGYITGFCGCFISQQLNCFGVIPSSDIVSSKSTWDQSLYPSIKWKIDPREMPLGQIRQHGESRSQLLLERRYHSIQASINTVPTMHRRAGQVTGLVFRSENIESYPDLLGQWTGAGETYYLTEGEWIIDLVLTRIKPLFKLAAQARPGLSQVEGITLVTNRRKMQWGPGIAQVCDIPGVDTCEQRIFDITWEFNAIFDRVQWTYKREQIL